MTLKEIIEKIPSNIYHNNWLFSLTINFENIVYDFRDVIFYKSVVMNLINDYDREINSFNLTLRNGTSRIVFCTDCVVFSYYSRYITLNTSEHCFKYTDDICEKIFDVNKKYIDFSESIDNMYSDLKFF